MQFESIIHSKAPTSSEPAEPAYMVFRPDDGQHFQAISTGSRRIADLRPVRADLVQIPINGEDVQPLIEAKKAHDDDKLLPVIRKYVQTRGLGINISAPDSLKGTIHTVPTGSFLRNRRVRYNLQGEFNELPN